MTEKKTMRYLMMMAVLVLYTIWKIHLGLFHDEVQLVNLGKLLADGDGFVHFVGVGMSHYALYPLMALYHRIVGSYDGVFLYLRYWFVLIQAVLSIYVYTTLKLFWSERQAAAASALCMLFTFNYYSITYKSALFWLTMLSILFLLRHEKTKKNRYLILSALALSTDVLCYPPFTALLLVPMTRQLLKDRGSARRSVVIYWGVCAFCALAFLAMVLSRYSVTQVLETYLNGTRYEKRGLLPALKKVGVPLAMFLISELGVRFGKRSSFFNTYGKRLWAGLGVLLWCALLGIVLVKPETAQASRFWYVFLGLFMLMLALRRNGLLCVSNGGLVDILFFEVSVWTILAIALISDQGVAIIAYGSIFGLIGAVIALMDGRNDSGSGPLLFAGCLVVAMLVCSVVFVWDQNISYESSHIFQSRERLNEGPGRGIYVTAYTETVYDAYVEAARNVSVSGDRMFLISDLMRPVGTMAADVKEAIPCGYVIRSFLETSKGIDYCMRFPELSPTVVLVDTDFTGDYADLLENTVFGRYLNDHYEPVFYSEDGRWIALRSIAVG